MRKIIVSTFVSLDGVMQGPGAVEEDPTGGFTLGGWTAPYFDEVVAGAVTSLYERPFDLLLGRKTFDIFAAHWPYVPTEPGQDGYEPVFAGVAKAFNRATKHVASRSDRAWGWENTAWLGADPRSAVSGLRGSQGPDLLVQGSSEFLQTLLGADLVDELHLLIYPVVLGQGKRLFGDGARPRRFDLTAQHASSKGVLIARFNRAGDVTTGSFALETPTERELERREALA